MTGAEESAKPVRKSRKAPLSLRIFQLVLWLSVLGLIGFYSLRGAILVPPAPPAAEPAATGELLPDPSPTVPSRVVGDLRSVLGQVHLAEIRTLAADAHA
jgi:hypothetical protein